MYYLRGCYFVKLDVPLIIIVFHEHVLFLAKVIASHLRALFDFPHLVTSRRLCIFHSSINTYIIYYLDEYEVSINRFFKKRG